MDVWEKVAEKLAHVRDSETGLDVMRMKLVRNLRIEGDGCIRLTFRPSSVLCPRAFQLAIDVKEAVRAVPEVRQVHAEVAGFVQAELLAMIVNDAV